MSVIIHFQCKFKKSCPINKNLYGSVDFYPKLDSDFFIIIHYIKHFLKSFSLVLKYLVSVTHKIKSTTN